MKLFILILFATLSLNAGYFDLSSDNKRKDNPIEKFRSTYSYSNALVKKGDLAKYSQYKSNIKSLQKSLDTLDISKKEQKKLKKNMLSYTKIIDAVYKNMKKNTPNIYTQYNKSLRGLVSFNNGLESTGYAPLLSEWHDLARIKHKYTKKPSSSLSKKFHQKWESVVLVLTDLCIDEEYEEPLLNYLDLYKKYFEALDSVYDSVSYRNITRIKPLSYAIKANLELASQQEN